MIAKGVGRKSRRRTDSILTDPAVEERQVRAFELSVSGVSNVAIAKLVGVERRVVAADIKLEGQRRAHERAGNRAGIIDQSVSRYERLIGDAMLRMQTLRNDALQAQKWTAKARFHDLVRLEAIEIRKLQRQSEEVQGLHVTLAVDASTTNNFNLAVDSALAHYASVPVEMRSEMRHVAREDRKAAFEGVVRGGPILRDALHDVP